MKQVFLLLAPGSAFAKSSSHAPQKQALQSTRSTSSMRRWILYCPHIAINYPHLPPPRFYHSANTSGNLQQAVNLPTRTSLGCNWSTQRKPMKLMCKLNADSSQNWTRVAGSASLQIYMLCHCAVLKQSLVTSS